MTQDLYFPTEAERQMIDVLSDELRKLGHFHIKSIELLSDDELTLLFSVQPPDSFSTSGKEMTLLHTAAQDVSDKYDRNLVVTTTAFSEGGRKVAYDPRKEVKSDNIVQLNPNKPQKRQLSAASAPPIEVLASSSPIYFMENCLSFAQEYFARGFLDESTKLAEKLSEVILVLLKNERLSNSDDEVEEICFDIGILFVDLKRRGDADKFLVEAGYDSLLVNEKLDEYAASNINKLDVKEVVLREAKTLLDQLNALIKQ